MDISHRQFNKRIQFKDREGNALSNKQIHIKQNDHSFLFGCGAFDFMPYIMNGDEEHRKLTESWLDIFNYGTLPFYWGNYEKEEGRTEKDLLMKTANYLKELGYQTIRLGIDKENPQSNHFWKKNGFEVIQETDRNGWMILIGERKL